MGNLANNLLRALILDDSAYQEWRERPNLFLRGILLIIVISLAAGLVSFAVNLVNRLQPFDGAEFEAGMSQVRGFQSQWFPGEMDADFEEIWDTVTDLVVPMVSELAEVETRLPQGITGFLNAFGGWLSRAVTAIGGWLFYGALVLLCVNLLGGSAKLPDFFGMVALYAIPGLLGLLEPVRCLGGVLAFVGTIWSTVIYIKATSVVADLDLGRATLAVIAPIVVLALLGALLAIMAVISLAILF